MVDQSNGINYQTLVLTLMTKNNKILEDLFYNKLDIRNSLPIWVNNMVKYGNATDFELPDDLK